MLAFHPLPEPRPVARQFRSDMTEAAAIIARMVEDLEAEPALAAEGATIERSFFTDRGWSRHQVACYGPRAIERFTAPRSPG